MIIRFNEVKSKIIKEIEKRVPDLKCPICKKGEMILMDGFIDHFTKKEIDTTKLDVGRFSVPTVIIVCKHCGHVIQFAIGAFGFLLNEKKEKIKPSQHGKKSQKKEKEI